MHKVGGSNATDDAKPKLPNTPKGSKTKRQKRVEAAAADADDATAEVVAEDHAQQAELAGDASEPLKVWQKSIIEYWSDDGEGRSSHASQLPGFNLTPSPIGLNITVGNEIIGQMRLGADGLVELGIDKPGMKVKKSGFMSQVLNVLVRAGKKQVGK